MDSEAPNQSSDTDARIEQEICSHRKFTLAEAIGRLGKGLFKGVSPVTGKRQAELVIERFLEDHLHDSEGALRLVLNRTVRESEILMKYYNHPLDSLARNLERLLDSEYRLRRFVGQVDTEWGRIYYERPYLEVEGRPAHPDDPYTFTSVEIKLTALLDELSCNT